MGQVLEFRMRPQTVQTGELAEIDLLTAVDVALRDLADLVPHIALVSARDQAEACRRMLQDAYDAAVGVY